MTTKRSAREYNDTSHQGSPADLVRLVRFVSLLLALLAVACDFGAVQVYAAPGLEGHTAVAVEAWNEALAEHCPNHPGLELVSERESSDVQVAWGIHPTMPSKGAVEDGGWIVVNPRVRDESAGLLEHVVAHEIGHALGAEHASSGLMVETADRDVDTAHVSREDVRQVCNDNSFGGKKDF